MSFKVKKEEEGKFVWLTQLEFKTFEEKTLEEQADEITKSIIWNDENPLFDFDEKD